ncbi:hydroxyphenylacetyl-CoA thioesterase PaaI [Pseudovibrio exalbescens]|uniref:hydroxyphenylacetyl-CoA thioesterase PaaI n=1 Tax=Pseudovibrio exalbescens TaxID=197461 RepID=UPI000C9AECF7|nr:hydroxyphenylacetyl-CoA thioesterase PaaI [Pseudovibrio exalbescens]
MTNKLADEMSPEELATACSKAMWDADEASRRMGMVIEHIAPGRSKVTMAITKWMCNGHGTAHGGFIFALADSAFAFACNSYNARTVAQHCSITYVAPALEGDELVASAQEVTRFGRNGIYDIRVCKQDGNLIAEFRGHSRQVRGTHVPEEGAE